VQIVKLGIHMLSKRVCNAQRCHLQDSDAGRDRAHSLDADKENKNVVDRESVGYCDPSDPCYLKVDGNELVGCFAKVEVAHAPNRTKEEHKKAIR